VLKGESVSVLDRLSEWEILVISVVGLFTAAVAYRTARRIFWPGLRLPPMPSVPNDPVMDDNFLASPSERRRGIRRHGAPVAIHVATSQGTKGPNCGWVVDRSTEGLCLMVERKVEVGTTLSLLPLRAPPATPHVEVEVKHCRTKEGYFYLGCRFVQTPPWAILLLFG
jgi:hypothetical protein